MPDSQTESPRSNERVDFTKSGKPVTHGGTGAAYAHQGCRCEECRAANTARVARRTAERAREQPPTHGKYSTYNNWGCRCEPCTKANTDKSLSYYRNVLSKAARSTPTETSAA